MDPDKIMDGLAKELNATLKSMAKAKGYWHKIPLDFNSKK
jgi:hypothetical protein